MITFDALGMSLFHFLWEGALIACLAAIALRLAGRDARSRYAVACLALLAMPAAFAVTLWLSLPGARIAIPRTFDFSRVTPTDPASPGGAPLAPDFAAYLKWAALAWLAGVVCVLAYRLAAWIFAVRLRRRGTCEAPAPWISRVKTLAARLGVSRPVILLESCLAEVPVVIGYLRPAILVPVGMLAGLPAEHVEAILLHELAHIRRADYLVGLAQSAVEAILFYHPAVWWISGVIRAERENCCDDLAVALEGDPHTYATALLTLEQTRSVPGPALAANHGDLLRRVRRVLGKPDSRDINLPVVPVAILLIAAGIAFVARAQPPQTPAPAVQQTTEIPGPYQKWLNEEVVYIITDVERKGFEKLTDDQDRAAFVKDFWLFRDPTPDTAENEFRDEHYRRLAYANNRFKSSIPGWKTDRGRIYIVYGPPDEIESHPSGDITTAYPFEKWLYRYIEGIGTNVIIEFVDATRSGDYKMTTDPNPPRRFPGHHIAVSTLPTGETMLSIPLDFTDDVQVSGRATNSSGFAVAWFDQTVPHSAGTALVKTLKLAPGSYTVTVTVRDLKTTYSESVNVEVK